MNAAQTILKQALRNVILNPNAPFTEDIQYVAAGQTKAVCIKAVVNQSESLALIADTDGQAAHLTADIYVDACDVPTPSVKDVFVVRSISYKLVGVPETAINGLRKMSIKTVDQYEKTAQGYRISR
jgi:hypothetical protein